MSKIATITLEPYKRDISLGVILDSLLSFGWGCDVISIEVSLVRDFSPEADFVISRDTVIADMRELESLHLPDDCGGQVVALSTILKWRQSQTMVSIRLEQKGSTRTIIVECLGRRPTIIGMKYAPVRFAWYLRRIVPAIAENGTAIRMIECCETF